MVTRPKLMAPFQSALMRILYRVRFKKRTRPRKLLIGCLSCFSMQPLHGFGLLTPLGFFGVFAAQVFEEAVKTTCFFLRFRSTQWYTWALKEGGLSGLSGFRWKKGIQNPG